MILFTLEQVLLALFALALWNCVLGNALHIDVHYRVGLGITLVGLAYLTAHAVYLTPLKEITESVGELADALPAKDGKETGAAKESDESTSAKPGKRPSTGISSLFMGIIPDSPNVDIRSVVVRPAGSRGYAEGTYAANSSPSELNSVSFSGDEDAAGYEESAQPATFAMAAGASSGRGRLVVVGARYRRDSGPAQKSWRQTLFGPGSRTLSEPQFQGAIKLLKTKPRQNVLIITMKGAGDGPQVADQLIDVFSSAGWDVFAEPSEMQSMNGNAIGQGIRFVAPDKEHESVRIAWDAFKDTPVRPASILPMQWRMSAPGSDQVRVGPPLTIVVGTP